MTTLTPAVETAVNPDDIKVIVGGLQAYNASRADGESPAHLVVSLRDESGAIVGGLFGATYLGWLHVQALWVPESLQRQGHGKALLALAEAEAIRRGCPRVFLETLEFQAPHFYGRLGYVLSAQIPDFPPGGMRYAFTKMLVPADDASATTQRSINSIL
jgi:GNAT superfamily N-acetyltransferase